MFYGILVGQLRRLYVAAANDPELGAEERADEGKVEVVESRQLGGVVGEDAAASGSGFESVVFVSGGREKGQPLRVVI